MGIEDSIKNIQQVTFEVKKSVDKIHDFMGSRESSELQSSVRNLSIVLLNLEEKIDSMSQTVESSRISSELQSSIESLPHMIANLEKSLGNIQKTFETTTEETKNDLKFIKVSYVEDVVGNMRNLSKEISDLVKDTGDKTTALYTASVGHFESLIEKLNNIESSTNALIENQTDQLATVADLRDRVNAIIQVELASLRDRIAIYLESNVNELKTSVTERLAIQDATLQKLTQATEQLAQNVSTLPQVMQQEINAAVEKQIITELASMKKEMKKMTAFIIRTQRTSES